MEKNQDDLFKWSLNKAEEFLDSAKSNIDEGRYIPAAEEIFRAVETLLEAMLYKKGIKEIRYPGKQKDFKGRLALQFLIRDNLLKNNIISKEMFDKYLEIETELHESGYTYGKTFEKSDLEDYLEFAENLFFKAQAMN